MATAVIMPRQGQSVESCIITEWHKQVGDSVEAGEKLFTYETDKSVFEEEAKESGTLLARFFEEDDDVPVLVNVAVIGQPGQDISGLAPEGQAPAADKADADDSTQTHAAATEQSGTKSASEQQGSAIAISPRAKATALRIGLDPGNARPTGPSGRIIERDIFAAANSLPDEEPIAKAPSTLDTVSDEAKNTAAQPEYNDKKLSNMRKVIAKSMHHSLSSMAQLTHTTSFDASCILAYRKELKASMESTGIPNITLNDMILFAVSRVLPKHGELNAHFLDDKMRYFTGVHLGIAVDTPRGLMVPTIRNAHALSLGQLAQAAKALATQAQQGSINPDDLEGASFTVSNLGALGIEHFTPVINPPQTGILGVNNIIERVRTVEGQVCTYPAMGLSLTYDHRALDGAPASRFLMDLCAALEHFTALLV